MEKVPAFTEGYEANRIEYQSCFVNLASRVREENKVLL
jgi:hypothetical protein